MKLRPNRDALAQRILEESEVSRLIEAAAPGRNRVLLKLLYVSGVRVSEVCGLKWCDAMARQDAGQIAVFGKGGKTRTILLRCKVWLQLLSIKGDAQAVDPIFPSRNGGGALDVSQVRSIVYTAESWTRAEGLPPLVPARPRFPRSRSECADSPSPGDPGPHLRRDDRAIFARPGPTPARGNICQSR